MRCVRKLCVCAPPATSSQQPAEQGSRNHRRLLITPWASRGCSATHTNFRLSADHPTTVGAMSSPKRRLETDVMQLLMSNYDIELVNDNMREFYVRFQGPDESTPPAQHPWFMRIRADMRKAPFAGGIWKIHVELPEDYPYKSPSIGFKNRIFHPNIDEVSGSVCLDVINQAWTPLYGLMNVFDIFIPQLLRYPNASDPLNGEAAALLMGQPQLYEQRVKEYVQRYASDLAVGQAQNEESSDEEEMSDVSFSDEDEPANMDP